MTIGQLIELLVGLQLVISIMVDIFLTVVVPRRAPRTGRLLRISRYVVFRLWFLWRWIGLRFNDPERRESFLGSYGALTVMLLLVSWLAGLILGYGLLLDALRDQLRPPLENLGASVYFAGESL